MERFLRALKAVLPRKLFLAVTPDIGLSRDIFDPDNDDVHSESLPSGIVCQSVGGRTAEELSKRARAHGMTPLGFLNKITLEYANRIPNSYTAKRIAAEARANGGPVVFETEDDAKRPLATVTAGTNKSVANRSQIVPKRHRAKFF